MPKAKDIRATRAIDVVEAAYRLDGTEQEWLDQLLAVARPDVDTGCGVYAFTGGESVPNLPASPVFVQHDLDAGFAERLMELNVTAPQAVNDVVRTRLVSCGGLEQFFGPSSVVVAHFRQLMQPIGVVDGFSMFVQDAQGGSLTMSSPARDVLAPAPRVRGIWQRAGLHVVAALRLRRKLAARSPSSTPPTSAREALLEPSGRIAHAGTELAADRPAREALMDAVHAMERARGTDVRSSPDRALRLWRGLVAGEWSLVDHWEQGGRRYIAAYQNRPTTLDPRALTSNERAVLEYVVLGATNKEIVYALGLAEGTVSTCVTQILRKLRVRKRVDLAALSPAARAERLDVEVDGECVGVLAVDVAPATSLAERLSPAEREVTSFVTRGMSNEQIAQSRGVSVPTIAKQLRAIFDKLGVDNRSQLARLVASGED
ncbi:hypothetical protein AKJ09_01943 [Labilithrix luteola]|uniref:HTH luxR-type domain-containing protein n=1 Tax=Labilithrix luteola TaxID=1391654 RepID=A0A0K1PQ94_9BACT|nr:helix-turn-helix transcriptional regulator [Labilithrix luteola]AKU95279.1 hypothetical protein AKJ09_01943 [Labilithrix luteola]